MRIALLADTYPPENRGGAGIVVERLARRFTALGHDTLVVSTSRSTDSDREQDGVRVVRFRSAYPERFRSFVAMRNPLMTGKVARALRFFKPDVVHAHNVHQHLSFGSLGAAALTGAPVAYTAHDYLLFCAIKLVSTGGEVDYRQRWFNCAKCQRLRWNPVRNTAIRRAMSKHVDHLFAISVALQTALRANAYGGAEVIYNGVDPDWWIDGNGGRFRAAHGLGDAPVALLAARISRDKGAEAAVRALARSRVKELRLVIAGDNPRYAAKLRAMAQELNVADRLVLPGWLTPETLRDAYHAAAVTLAPSTYPDPFGLTLIESMACGTPAIASVFGGGPEVVADGVTGFVANPLDTPALADRMDLLVENQGRTARMRTSSIQRVRDLFTLDQQVARTLARYDALRRTAA